jgi:hypothetical protein
LVGQDSNAFHNSFDGLTFKTSRGGDNYGAIHVKALRGDYTVIKNCNIEGGGDSIHQNTAGIYINRLNHVKIFNNKITNVPIGIYFKHTNEASLASQTDIEVAYNYFEHNVRASLEWNGRFGLIHNNIFGAHTEEASFNNDNGGAGGDYNIISNNTFSSGGIRLGGKSGGSSDIFPGAQGNKIIENIFQSRVDVHLYSSLAHNTEFSRNLHPSTSSVVTGQNRSVLPLSSDSIVGTPLYEGGEESIKFYMLKDASPGKIAGENNKDVGASLDLFFGNSL